MASQCCSWVTTSQEQGYECGQLLAMLGMEGYTPMVREASAANGDEEMLAGSEDETYRSVVGILMYFKRVSICGNGEFFATKGHMRRLATFKERETCIWNWFDLKNS